MVKDLTTSSPKLNNLVTTLTFCDLFSIAKLTIVSEMPNIPKYGTLHGQQKFFHLDKADVSLIVIILYKVRKSRSNLVLF